MVDSKCVNYNENEALLFFIRTFNDNFKWTLEIFGSRYQMLFSHSFALSLSLALFLSGSLSHTLWLSLVITTLIFLLYAHLFFIQNNDKYKTTIVCVCCALFLSFFPSVFFLKLGTAGKVTFKILICSWLIFFFSCSFWEIQRNNTSSI